MRQNPDAEIRTRHRPQRTNVANLEARIARYQSALREVTTAATLEDAVSTADAVLNEDVL